MQQDRALRCSTLVHSIGSAGASNDTAQTATGLAHARPCTAGAVWLGAPAHTLQPPLGCEQGAPKLSVELTTSEDGLQARASCCQGPSLQRLEVAASSCTPDGLRTSWQRMCAAQAGQTAYRAVARHASTVLLEGCSAYPSYCSAYCHRSCNQCEPGGGCQAANGHFMRAAAAAAAAARLPPAAAAMMDAAHALLCSRPPAVCRFKGRAMAHLHDPRST